MWTIRQTSEPSYEPVSLEAARGHLYLTASGSPATHPDDSLVESYIEAARMAAEKFTDRVLPQRTFELRAKAFDKEMTLPIAPVQSIDSIEYTDTDGNSQTFTDYTVDLNAEPAIIEIDEPPTIQEGSRLVVTVTAGYGSSNSPADADLIPQAMKQAILMLVGHFYENRTSAVVGETVSSVPMAFRDLLWPYRLAGV